MRWRRWPRRARILRSCFDITTEAETETTMHLITIEETLLQCGDARVVIAKDGDQRSLVGVSHGQQDAGDFVFVQIDRVTVLELERGTVDLRTVLADRCAGILVGAVATHGVAGVA
jgi:hypothetical protein